MTITGARRARSRPGDDGPVWHAGPGGPAGSPVPVGAPGAPLPRRPGARRIVLVAGLVALAAVAAIAVVSDLGARSELRQEQASLRTTRSRLGLVLADLQTAQSKLDSTSAQQETLHVALELATWELSGAQKNLADAKSSLSSQQSAISTLNTCLGGVERALNQISVGDQDGAVSSIGGVSSSCQSVQGTGSGGPVFPFDFPDPDVLRVGDTYFAYSTNSATGDIQTIESTNLSDWQVVGDALSHLPAWARPDDTWAPGVIELQGRFVLFYAAAERSSGKECISVALSPTPQGPFLDDTSQPLVCQVGLGGSIDPSPFEDADGNPYLVWKSNGDGGHPATIWAQPLAAGGTALAGAGPTALLEPTLSWEGGVVEGPDMVLESGHYDLFYSANQWNGPDYAIGVAQCAGPLGPCTKPLTGPLLASGPTFVSPGGPSLFTDTQGGWWMAFHGYLPDAVGYPQSRLLFVRPVTFDDDGLPVVGSSDASG